MPRARATVRLTLGCNNRCVFCVQDGLAPGASGEAPVEAARAALARAREAHDEVTFTGGEPTLHPDLPALVAEARALGFARVGAQTNARRLAYGRYADALAAAGLTDLQTSVHGPEAAVHDYHVGAPGAFAQTFAGVAAARARGLAVVAATVVTRSNFRNLPELPRLLAARGVGAWRVVFPVVAGRAEDGFDRVLPRVALAAPFALRALEAARALALPADALGAPLCALGPLAGRAAPSPPRAYDAKCEGCAARAACPGLDGRYLARYGAGELVVRADLPAAVPMDPALARMFVGEGERAAPRASAVVEPPPEKVRVALPMLGKSAPARREVAPGTAKRSGRELFPELFREERED